MTVDDPRLLDAIDDASMILYYMTGRQFAGTCTATVDTCSTDPCGCCGCDGIKLNLGLWPITDLISVIEDDVTYTGTAATDRYEIVEYRYIRRVDRTNFTGLSGITATVEYGMKTPRLLERATRVLACQLLQKCLDLPCSLPERVTSYTRSGMSVDLKDPTELLAAGRMGIYEVDLAVQVFNPSHLQSPSFVWSGNTSSTRYHVSR